MSPLTSSCGSASTSPSSAASSFAFTPHHQFYTNGSSNIGSYSSTSSLSYPPALSYSQQTYMNNIAESRPRLTSMFVSLHLRALFFQDAFMDSRVSDHYCRGLVRLSLACHHPPILQDIRAQYHHHLMRPGETITQPPYRTSIGTPFLIQVPAIYIVHHSLRCQLLPEVWNLR